MKNVLRIFKLLSFSTSIFLYYTLITLSPVLAQTKSLLISNLEATKIDDQEQVINLNKVEIEEDLEERKISINRQQTFSLENSQETQNSTNQQPLLENPVYLSRPPALNEVYNVHQLKDVTPEDWAYEALRSLVEKYRCISGFPNETFRGNRVITRFEFAIALNTCLVKINRLVDNFETVSGQQDLAVIKRLQSEFATEIQKTTEKIGNLEKRVAFIEEHKFSPTSILKGTVEFNVTSDLGGDKAVLPGQTPGKPLNTNITLAARTNLNIDTSFTGRDKLRVSFNAGNNSNYNRFITGTDMTLLTGRTNTAENFRIGTIYYQFPLSDRIIAAIAPAADFPTRVFPALNPVFSISNFGSESPIYSYASGSGAVIYYNISDQLAAGISYLTSNGSDVKRGFFNGQHSILSQITYTPTDKIGVAFTYGHYYSPTPISTNVTGSKGSQFGEYPFGLITPTSSNNFGLQFTYKLTDKLTLGGWVSYFNPIAEDSPSVSGLDGLRGASADIWSMALTASWVDLLKSGSQLSFVIGMPPKVTKNDLTERQDQDTAIHLEVSYRYPINNNIFIIPGFLLIINPEHNSANAPIGIALIRTSFSF